MRKCLSLSVQREQTYAGARGRLIQPRAGRTDQGHDLPDGADHDRLRGRHRGRHRHGHFRPHHGGHVPDVKVK